MEHKKSDSVFPYVKEIQNIGATPIAMLEGGLSKRELVAALVLQSFVGNKDTAPTASFLEAACSSAVNWADALLEELGKQP